MDGVRRVARGVLVNTSTADDQFAHQVSHDGQGSFVVTWQTWGPNNRVFGQRYTATGVRRGSEFPVSATPVLQGSPSVGSDAVGNLVIAWHAFPPGGPVGIFGRRFGSVQARGVED